MTEGLTRKGLVYAATNLENAIWMPLTYLAYGIDYELGGKNHAAAIAHTGNVLWHGLNSVLLFWLLLGLCGSRNRPATMVAAFLSSILWAVHPLRCESVVWLSSKKDVLSAFWLLAALLMWVRWRLNHSPKEYVLSLLALVIGAMCKPSVMVFIGLAALLDWICFDRWSRKEMRRLALEYVLPFSLCLTIAVEASLVQHIGGGTIAFIGVPLWWRVVNAICSIGVYLLHTILPIGLAPQCMMQWPSWPKHLLPGFVLAGAFACWTWHVFKSKSKCLVGTLWFLGCLVPFLGLSGFGYHAYADRFTYIPGMGISCIIAFVIYSIFNPYGRVAFGICFVIGIAFSCLSWRQTKFWEDDLTLWSHTLEVDGADNYIANLNLGAWHWEFDHNVEKCVAHFSKAWAHDPAAVSHDAFYYVAALSECGKMREADKIVNDLAMLAHDTIEAGQNAQRTLVTREFSTILLFAAQTDTVHMAEQKLRDIMAIDSKSKDMADILFLQAKIAETKGDTKQATHFYQKCSVAASEKLHQIPLFAKTFALRKRAAPLTLT